MKESIESIGQCEDCGKQLHEDDKVVYFVGDNVLVCEECLNGPAPLK